MVGLVSNLDQVCGQGWQGAGDRIYLLGARVDEAIEPLVTLGGSEYLAEVHGVIAGQPPQVDFALERRVQAACREGIRHGWVRSAHDCAEGGLAIALAESCITGQMGAEITLPAIPHRWDHVLFAEGGARIVVSVAAQHCTAWEDYLQQALPENWQPLGTVSGENMDLTIASENLQRISASLADMGDRWYTAIERRLAAD